MMRILGIDYGSKRIGLAISDEKGLLALGKGIIENISRPKSLQAIKDLVESERITRIVVGLPRKFNDTIGRRAKEVLSFVAQIKQGINIPVETWDERLTTAEAEEMLRGVKLSRPRKRRHLNTVAAQLILQGYLDSHRHFNTSSGRSRQS